MNLQQLQYELHEIRAHIDDLLEEIKQGKTGPGDDFCVAENLGHILDHFCFAWNSRHLTPEEAYELPEEEFQRMKNMVPNFGAGRTVREHPE